MNLLDLPEGCLSHILSLTSPFYVLRCSLVCKLFHSLANSDLVWDKFLPSDCHPMMIQRSQISGQQLPFTTSKKHLVLHLCRSFVLLPDCNMSFSLDKWTAKKCYMLGARDLSLVSGDNPYCWKWKPLPESRFPEIVELLGVSHLQITGRIATKLLSPNTNYRVYFSFQLQPRSQGFDLDPVVVSVARIDSKGVYLNGGSFDVPRTFYLKAPESSILDNSEDDTAAFTHQRDGHHRWLKIDMGKYCNLEDGEVAVLEMNLMGMETSSPKSGLIVHGIELVPLD